MPDYFMESLEKELDETLTHYGVKGMKWDVRRYQYEDGSLTPEGKRRLRQAEREYSARRNASSTSGDASSGRSGSSGSGAGGGTGETNTKSSAASKKETTKDKLDKVSEKLMVEANNAAFPATSKVYEKWADKLQGYGDIRKSPYFEKYIKEYSEVMESSMNAHARLSENKNVEIDGEVYEVRYKVVNGMAEPDFKKVSDDQNDNEEAKEKRRRSNTTSNRSRSSRRASSGVRHAEEESDSLSHFGILGMKWGVRRYQREDGTRTPAGKKREAKARGSDDFEETRSLAKKGMRHLSTKELQDLTKRLSLEKNYRDLITGINRTRADKGFDFIKKITAAGATIASLYGLVKTPLGQDLIKLLKGTASK